MALAGAVADAHGASLVTPQNVARLRGLPIFLFSGAEDDVYAPRNTDVSFTALCEANGSLCYERQVFEGRGHLDAWMGPTAREDVFPRVWDHVENVRRGRYAEHGGGNGKTVAVKPIKAKVVMSK